MSYGKMILLNTAADLQWVREVHCPQMPDTVQSVVLHGAEDYPTAVYAFDKAEPLFRDVPVYTWRRDDDEPVTDDAS